MTPFKRFFERINSEQVNVRNKLLFTFTICLILSSITSIIFNNYLGLTHEVNLVVIIITLINSTVAYLSYINKITNKGRFIYLMIIVSFLPPAWIFNGGLAGSIPMHFFIYLAAGILVLSKKYRNIFLTYQCILIGIALIIEHKFTYLIYPYESERIKLIDLEISFIQVTLSIIALTGTYTAINSAYQKTLIEQKKKLNLSYAELSLAKEKAENAAIAKSNFITNISHEIRTPLHAIVGITDLLKINQLNPEQQILLNSLATSSKTLSDLVDDLLDLSKIEANKMTLNNEYFNIRDIVNEVHDLISLQVKDKDIDIYTKIYEEVPINLKFDRLKYKQIIINLLSNAGKFTNKGTISCVLSFDKIKKELTTTIKDTGIGIIKEHLESIFIPFTQLNTNYQIENKGVGMGLAITKKMIELMGGTIHIQSMIEVGSTFIVTLPVESGIMNTNTHNSKLALTKNEHKIKSYKILVAEDNKINQIVIGKMLEKLNHDFDIVNNGEEAVDIAIKNKYDIILMDIQMPKKNGIDASNEICKYYSNLGLTAPIIIGCSANIIHQELNNPELACMTDYLTKPIGLEELSKKIRQLDIA